MWAMAMRTHHKFPIAAIAALLFHVTGSYSSGVERGAIKSGGMYGLCRHPKLYFKRRIVEPL